MIAPLHIIEEVGHDISLYHLSLGYKEKGTVVTINLTREALEHWLKSHSTFDSWQNTQILAEEFLIAYSPEKETTVPSKNITIISLETPTERENFINIMTRAKNRIEGLMPTT